MKEAPGAWRNGTRVAKIATQRGDGHADGALATVIGSIAVAGLVHYFVIWDDTPHLPVFIAGHRLRLAEAGA